MKNKALSKSSSPDSPNSNKKLEKQISLWTANIKDVDKNKSKSMLKLYNIYIPVYNLYR